MGGVGEEGEGGVRQTPWLYAPDLLTAHLSLAAFG